MTFASNSLPDLLILDSDFVLMFLIEVLFRTNIDKTKPTQ